MHIPSMIGGLIAATLISVPGFCSDMKMSGGMSMSAHPAGIGTVSYRFEVASAPKSDGKGNSAVSLRLVHVADKRPVSGAIIVESRADMSPIGMGAMTAQIKPTPSSLPGVYTFVVANGVVWKKPDKWALTFAAKVQGEAQTVRGTVVVPLTP